MATFVLKSHTLREKRVLLAKEYKDAETHKYLNILETGNESMIAT